MNRIIETQRLILRPVTEDDSDDIYEYSKCENVGPSAGWKPHESREETIEIMKRIFIDKEGVFGIVLKESGKVIGSAGLIADPKRENDKARMLGYALGENFWGQGYMTEAASAIIRYGFEEMKLDLLSAYIFPHNNKSRRVLEKCEFEYEGTLKSAEKLYNGLVLDNSCWVLTRKRWSTLSGIILKPLEDKDIDLLNHWLRKDYVQKWYKDADGWLHEINNRNGEYKFVHHFIAFLDGKPFGFCQYYDCFDAKEDWYEVTEIGVMYSIDYLIGEEEYLRRGLGKEIIKALEEEISSRTTAKIIVVQPEKENLPSNRALLASGYEFDKGLQYYIKNL